MRSVDLRQLEYFVTLADEQHFTRAAELCRVSQSGLSAAIRRLEGELNSVLFDRTTRRVVPTAAGLALLAHARTILTEAAAGRDAVIRASHALSGELRVGSEQCLGAVDVGMLLERFHRRYPEVDIQFIQAGSNDLIARVREGELDIAFVATADTPSAVSSVELGRRQLRLLVLPDDPLAARTVAEWSDLRDRDFIDFRPSWGVRSLNDAALASHGIHRQVGFSVDDVHTLIDLVQRGLGIALVPQHVAQKPEASGLVALPLPAAPPWIVSAVLTNATTLAPRLLDILADEDAARVEQPVAAG